MAYVLFATIHNKKIRCWEVQLWLSVNGTGEPVHGLVFKTKLKKWESCKPLFPPQILLHKFFVFKECPAGVVGVFLSPHIIMIQRGKLRLQLGSGSQRRPCSLSARKGFAQQGLTRPQGWILPGAGHCACSISTLKSHSPGGSSGPEF